jgi:hypothetical protein
VSFENYGKYQLIKKLATGGMAEIWLARQQGLEGFEKLMVVKRILPHLVSNARFLRLFLDETRIAARLDHPNIARILELGEAGETWFVSMEYVQGSDLREVLRRARDAEALIPLEVSLHVHGVATGSPGPPTRPGRCRRPRAPRSRLLASRRSAGHTGLVTRWAGSRAGRQPVQRARAGTGRVR